jgi:hypothetical protein
MADTKKNNLGAIQGNLTAAYNARIKRNDLFNKGYAVSPDKAKRDEYAAVGAEMDKNYNTGFQEIRRLEKEIKEKPKFQALTTADKERLEKIEAIKKQIPLPTRLAQGILPKGIFRSQEIAPPQERNENFEEVKSALIQNAFQKQQAPVSGDFKKAKEILLQESINQNVDQNKGESSNAPTENTPSQITKEPDVKAVKPSGRLYRVMYAGKTADQDEVYETKEDADAALEKAGGKGFIAGVNFSQKTRGVELPDEETQARKQRYIAQLEKSKSDKMAYDQNLKRIKSPEYKAEVKERLRLADEARLADERAEGVKFAKWSSDVSARRQAGAQLDFYKKQLGVLRRASSQARQAKDPITELAINQAIGAYTAGVPQESGAMQRAAEEGIIPERNKMLADQMRAAQEEEARSSRTAAANSDYNQYNRGNGLIARKPLGF